MSGLEVETERALDGYRCDVRVLDNGSETRHSVWVTDSELGRLSGGAADPELLVRESFAFLLERESKESILSEFRLSEISRYFPEYESEIRRRLATS